MTKVTGYKTKENAVTTFVWYEWETAPTYNESISRVWPQSNGRLVAKHVSVRRGKVLKVWDTVLSGVSGEPHHKEDRVEIPLNIQEAFASLEAMSVM